MKIRYFIKMKLVLIPGLIFLPALSHGFSFAAGADAAVYRWMDIKELALQGKGWVSRESFILVLLLLMIRPGGIIFPGR